MSTTIEIFEGKIDLPSLRLSWPALKITKGEIVLFMGSSNSPVSDFMFFLAGLQNTRHHTAPAKDGKLIRTTVSIPNKILETIKIDGGYVYSLNDEERAKIIGFIFNDPELSMVGVTAQEDIDHAFSAIELDSPVTSCYKEYGFSKEKLQRKVDVLSGGELHRLACLIAIERNPKVLFVDLTRSNLDDNFIFELTKRINKLADLGSCIFLAGISPNASLMPQKYLSISDEGVVHEDNSFCNRQFYTDSIEFDKICRPICEDIVLTIEGLCRTSVTAPVSFQIRKNEIVLLYGENGSGKTTIGLIICGRCKRSDYSGKYWMPSNVKPVLSLQHAARAFIENSVFAEKPNMEFWTDIGFSESEVLLHPRALGYGKLKLAASALALERSCGLCVLDEPTCGMDNELRRRFVQLLNKYHDRSVLILSHDKAIKAIGTCLEYGDIAS